MISQFEKYKGIHPGIVLERELKKRSLKQRALALSVGEHPQALNAITKGKRGLNVPLALKIERELRLEEGSLAMLQTYYDIKKAKEKHEHLAPNFSILRKSLFWDTDINSIDWDKHSRAAILRVFERGNEDERNEIVRFYGSTKIESTLNEAALANSA